MPPVQFAPLHSRSTHTTIASPAAFAATYGLMACVVPISVGLPHAAAALRFTQMRPQAPVYSFQATNPTFWLVSATDGVNISIELLLRRLLMRSDALHPDTGGVEPKGGLEAGGVAGPGGAEPGPPPPPPPEQALKPRA